ncbi:hypothetical protein BDF22DRAFT_744942 [Syncephalis plumigaleata]|nr:hypothetical protein BDF22DRAFT_744942 [Syncephalis plumigaleata]
MAKITKTSVHSVTERIYSRNTRKLAKNAVHLARGRSFAWQVAGDAITKLKLLASKESNNNNNNNNNSKHLSSCESENLPILPSSDLFFSHIEKVCARKLAVLTETRNDAVDGNLRKSNRLRERYVAGKDRRLCIANYYLRKARGYALMREMERSELIAQYKAEVQASPYATALLHQTHNTLVQHTVTAMNSNAPSSSSSTLAAMNTTQLASPLSRVVAGVFHPINCPQVAHLHTHTCQQNQSISQLSSPSCPINDKITMSNAVNEMYHRYLTNDANKSPFRDASSYATMDITVVPPQSTTTTTTPPAPIAPHCVSSTISSIERLNPNKTLPPEGAFVRIMALMVTSVAILLL